MKLAPIPKNEQERLAKLKSYQVLDTTAEGTFDEITQLAATLCETKISLVSLIDSHRQWFKSRYGLDAIETPRDISFCGHAIMSDEIFIVEDAQMDDRFSDNPLFTGEPHVRFYAGVPLVTPTGENVGTLCVIDPEKKTLNDIQKSVLRTLARHVVDLLELRHKNFEIEKRNRDLEVIQDKLRTSEQKHRLLFDQSVDAVMTLAPPTWKFNSANKATLELFGCKSAEEFFSLEPWHLSPEFQPDGETSATKARRMIETAMTWGGHFFEWTHLKVDGTPMNCTVLLSRISEDSDSYLHATVRDISIQKRAELELLESKKQLQVSNQFLERALEGANLGVWDWNLLTNEIQYDKGWASMLGLSLDGLPMDFSTWESRVHPLDLSQCLVALNDYFKGKTAAYEVLHRMKHEAGHWVYILSRGKFSEWDLDGKPIRFTGTHLDISEHKRLENQLIEAQSIAKIGSWSYNLITHEQTWSHEHYMIFEIPEPQPKEVLFKMYRERIHPDDLVVLDRLLDRAFKFGQDFIFNHRVMLDNGTRVKYVQGIGRVSKGPDGTPVSVSGTCRDRTEDVEKEEWYRALLESMSEGLVLQGPTGTILQFNQAALTILGHSEDQLLGKTSVDPSWKAINLDGSEFPGEEHPAMVTIRTGHAVQNVTMGISVNNQQTRWILINSVPVEKSTGRHALVTFSDITDLVRMNEENRFVLDALGIGVWKFNPISGNLNWDRTLFEMFDIPANEFTNDYRSWESALTDESKQEAVESLKLALEGKKEFNSTFEIKTRKGQRKFIGGRGKVIRNENGSPLMMYGINWDRTKEVELEHELQIERARTLHNSKLASIGQLAAGVGHEINNPLAIISGQVNILETLFKDSHISDPEILNRMQKIDTAVDRISNIVKGLRTFARSDDNQIVCFEAFDMIAETTSMLKEIYEKEGIVINIGGNKRVGFITGNRGRLQQVLINLLSNARDATQGQSQRLIDLNLNFATRDLEISVTDNGAGIPDTIRNKIFDPFFTTKELNKGTGIGLSLVSNILKEHEGSISVVSKVGLGSTFLVKIPIQYGDSAQVETTPVATKAAKFMGNVKLLVVDDEPDLLNILKISLRTSCREIVTASSAQEALDILSREEFDLVISDVKMPVIDGFNFLRLLRAKAGIKQPKFVFMTGGVDLSPAQQETIERDSEGVLLKPFKMDTILSKIKASFPDRF